MRGPRVSSRGDWPDLLTALIFVGLGTLGLFMAAGLEGGTLAQMGPGFLPRVVCVLLIAVGLAIGLPALKRPAARLEPLKLRPLAVASERRMAQFPGVPTTAEAGFPGIRMTHWLGIFAPKGTPEAVLDKLNAEIQAAIQTEAFKAGSALQNAEPWLGSRAEFTRQIQAEAEKLGKIATDLKIVAD